MGSERKEQRVIYKLVGLFLDAWPRLSESLLLPVSVDQKHFYIGCSVTYVRLLIYNQMKRPSGELKSQIALKLSCCFFK